MEQTDDNKTSSWQDDLAELIHKKKEESIILKKLEVSLQNPGLMKDTNEGSEDPHNEENNLKKEIDQTE